MMHYPNLGPTYAKQTQIFLWLFLGRNQYRAGSVYEFCVYYMTGAPEGSTESGSGEAGNRTYDPWFTRHYSAYQLHHGGFKVL